jgi:hypothetical protein
MENEPWRHWEDFSYSPPASTILSGITDALAAQAIFHYRFSFWVGCLLEGSVPFVSTAVGWRPGRGVHFTFMGPLLILILILLLPHP